jgi:hypothetical protein
LENDAMGDVNEEHVRAALADYDREQAAFSKADTLYEQQSTANGGATLTQLGDWVAASKKLHRATVDLRRRIDELHLV